MPMRVTAPREITESQENAILEKLAGVTMSPVIVAAYSTDPESAGYATQLAAVLRKADVEVTLTKGSMNDFKGVTLGTVNLMKQPLSGLHELAQAFMAACVTVVPGPSMTAEIVATGRR